MAKITAKASQADNARTFEGDYDFGDDLKAMIGIFDEETVFENAKAQMTIGLQAAMRRWMQPDADGNTKADAEIQKLVSEWKPGKKQVQRKSKLDKAQDLFASMSDEERKALMAKLTGGTSKPAPAATKK